MSKYFEGFKYGIHVEKDGFSAEEVAELRKRFFSTLQCCKEIREECGVEEGMKNTIHHVLFLDPYFQKIIENKKYRQNIEKFFGGKKYVLNSLGGNNNIDTNYANNIHRDVRFFAKDKLMLNTIWCISPINIETGGTEFMIGSEEIEFKPSDKEFDEKVQVISANPGDVIYFDSRIWHRAGVPKATVDERIIYTPIFTRPFIKPGFDYAKVLKEQGPENFSEFIKQIASYYSDIPENHYEWYNFKQRCFYQKEQDV